MPSLKTLFVSCLLVFPIVFLATPEAAHAADYQCHMLIKHNPPLGSGTFTSLTPPFPKYYSSGNDVAAIGWCQNENNNEALDHCSWHDGDHVFTLRYTVKRYSNGFYQILVMDDQVDWQCIDAYPYYAELSPREQGDRPALARLSPPALPFEQGTPATRRIGPVALFYSRIRFIAASADAVSETGGDTLPEFPQLQSRAIEVFIMSSSSRWSRLGMGGGSHH